MDYNNMYGMPQNTYMPRSVQPQMQPSTAGAGFMARPVTSREEALAAQTDYFSAGTIMPDLAHGVIYMKRFNPQTGASDFLEFTYKAPEPPRAEPKYATAEELEQLREELEAIKNARKAVKKNDAE